MFNLFRFLRRTPRSMALEIDATAIRFLQLEVVSHTYRVVLFLEHLWTSIPSTFDDVEMVLKSCISGFKSLPGHVNRVVLSFPHEMFIYHTTTVCRKLAAKEQYALLQLELENKIQRPMESFYFDYRVMDSVHCELDMVPVECVAIPCSIVTPWIEGLDQFGFRVTVVDTPEDAMRRAEHFLKHHLISGLENLAGNLRIFGLALRGLG